MLNPYVIQRLREVLAADPHLDRFKQQPLMRLPLRFGLSPPPPQAIEVPAETGQMRPPELMLGEPEDPGCLAGVADYPLGHTPARLQAVDHARIIGNDVVVDQSGGVFGPGAILTEADQTALLRKNATNHQGFLLHQDGGRIEAVFAAATRPDMTDRSALFLHNLVS